MITTLNNTLRTLFCIKKCCLCLLLIFSFWAKNALAEGSKQLTPSPSDIVMLMTNRAEFGNFAAYGTSANNRLYFSIKDAEEIVYLGFSREYSANGTPQFFGNYEFRIVRASDNAVVHGPYQVGLTTENISSWSAAALGPFQVTGEGYSASGHYAFDPSEAGDYYIEFKDVEYIGLWDITVAKDGQAMEGRVWSKNWAFRTPQQNNSLPECLWDREFNGALFSYTEDGFVTRIDFTDSGFQGLSFNIAFNETGPGTSGNLGADRMSITNVNTSANLGQHKIFLNEPSIDLFPSGSCGDIASAGSFVCNGDGEFCLPVTTTQAGLMEIILDFNQNGMLDNNSSDVLLIHDFTMDNLTDCVPWDGMKGDSSSIEFDDRVNIIFRYAQGVQHWSVYDGEFLKNGFCVEAIRPNCGDDMAVNMLYWDDRNIEEESGTLSEKDGRDGCDCETENCRTWNNFELNVDDCSQVADTLTTGYGDRNTLNTWWFANVVFYEEVNVPILGSQLTGPSSICTGETATITVETATNENIQSFEWYNENGLLGQTAGNEPSFDIYSAGTYEVVVITESGCTTSSKLTVEEEICPVDISIQKYAGNLEPYRGDMVQFSIEITNDGPGIATGVEITDYFGSGFVNIQNVELAGIVGNNIIQWSGIELEVGESITLTYEALVQFSGSYINAVEVTTTNEDDIDSTPGNGVDNGEDDEAVIELFPLDCEVNIDITNILCSDNGTPTDPSDDQFTFVLSASGQGVSDNWLLSGDIVGQGIYDAAQTFGPFPISGGILEFELSDELVTDCSFALSVTPPATCSDECLFESTILSISCLDNGTPSDASDDLYTFEIMVSSVNNTSTTWSSSIGFNGNYDEVTSIGPLSIADGAFDFQVFDVSDPSCMDIVSITPPATCSDLCAISATVSNVLCSANGTPSEASDDTYTFDVYVEGFNLGASWTSVDGSQSGAYEEVITLGPFAIANGDISMILIDSDDPNCTTEIFVEAPSTCSDICAISATIDNVICSDNGTPSDASDDTYTFEVYVDGFNLGSGWTSADGSQSGIYEEVITLGPFAIANGDINMTLVDVDDSNCTTEIFVEAPTTCSDLCEISATVTNVICSDNGTPSDASDDTYTFDVLVDGFNLGSNWSTLDGVENGAYNEIVTLGPFAIANGDISMTLVDAVDSNCTTEISVEAPSTCSDVCDITAEINNVLCDDNGTPSDASDDTFTFDVYVSGFNIGLGWLSSDGGEFGTYNEVITLGPYAISGGDISMTLVDGANQGCTTEIFVAAPATCSDLCAIAATVQNIVCNDNGTPSIATDDLFTFEVMVDGFNLGSNWTTPHGSGPYNEMTTMGPFVIEDGIVEMGIIDAADNNCITNISVTPPLTCSDVCDIQATVMSTLCDDNGTPSDASDDTFTCDIMVEGLNLGENWSSMSGNHGGNYNEIITLGPFPIANGNVEMTLVDALDPNCTTTFLAIAPSTCSDLCEINTTVSNLSCLDNGTPWDASDDTYTFDVLVEGFNLGGNWSSTEGNISGTYNQLTTIGPFPIADGSVAFTLFDNVDVNCQSSFTVEPPATCSDQCLIEVDSVALICDDNGTLFAPEDDVFYVDVLLSGFNLGASWGTTFGQGGNYEEVVRLGPFSDFELDFSILILDAEDPSCNFLLEVSPPEPCFLVCEMEAEIGEIYCDENGTPENGLDDQYYFEVLISNLPLSGNWQASNGQSGIADSLYEIGPFAVADGDVQVTFFDAIAMEECFVEVEVASPTTSIICPEDTSRIAQEREMQVLLGQLDKSDEIYPEIDTFCWVSHEIPDGIHYFDTIKVTTGPEIIPYEVFTFILYTNFPISNASGSLPDEMVDGLGALFRGQYDELNPCCNILTGLEVPYIPGAEISWYPDWEIDVPQLDSLMPILQFSVRLQPNDAYTLLTSSWTTGLEGEYGWVVFSNETDHNVEFVHNEVDTEDFITDGAIIYDLMPSDIDFIYDLPTSVDYTGMASVIDSCGLDTIIFNDSLVLADCDDDIIYREFIAFNASGQSDTCTQEIIFNLPTLEDVVFPDWRVIFNCGDEYLTDENGNPHATETGYPYIHTAFEVHDLNPSYFNLSATYSDSVNTYCGATSEIYRTWVVHDSCVVDDSLTFTQLIKLGMEEVVIECPTSNHYCPILEENIMLFTVDPFETTADIELQLPEVTGSCLSNWLGQIDLFLMIGDSLELIQTILPGEDRFIEDLAIGDYTVRYTVMDDCNTFGVLDCIIRVADLQEPIAICHGGLNFSIGNFGVRRIYTQQINNGSYDNIEVESIQIRRKYMTDPVSCDPLSEVEFSEWGPWVEVTCCDVGNFVTVEMLVVDIYGNENLCWTDVLIEDKTAPNCFGIDDVAVNCADVPVDFDPFNTDQLIDLFGNVMVVDNCEAGIVAVEPVVNLDSCGNGTIIREFYAEDLYGNISNTVTQVVTIGGESSYDIRFPADTLLYCNDLSLIDTVALFRRGCDLVAVSYEDQLIQVSDSTCFEYERTYSVINWCQYDGITDPIVISRDEDCDGLEGEEAVWVIHRLNESYIDRDSLAFNDIPMAGEKGLECDFQTNPEGYWNDTLSVGYWQYTQKIYIQDTLAPIIQFAAFANTTCVDDMSCEAILNIDFEVDTQCDLDIVQAVVVFWDLDADGTPDVNLTEEGQVSGIYPNYNFGGSFPIGSNRFIVVATDVCGNTTQEEILIEVIPCFGITDGCTNAPSNYEIKFPKDVFFACELGPLTDSIEVNSLACDLLAVSFEDELIPEMDSLICTQIRRTYSVINWCEYDGISDPVVISRDENCNGQEGEENVWVLRQPTEVFIDRDSLATNLVPMAGEKATFCDGTTNPDGYWRLATSNGYWQYDQLITVFATTFPDIQLGEMEDDLFMDPGNCEASMDLAFEVVGGCFGDGEVEVSVWADEFQDGTMDIELRSAGFVDGTFPNFSINSNFPYGSHTLYFEITDQCNHTATQELSFDVIDGYVDAVQCMDTIYLDMQALANPSDIDGDGDIDNGMVMLDVMDVVEELITDCSGEVNYSINPIDVEPDSSITNWMITCNDDAELQMEVYVWDNADNPYAVQPNGTIGGPNYDWCITTVMINGTEVICSPDTDIAVGDNDINDGSPINPPIDDEEEGEEGPDKPSLGLQSGINNQLIDLNTRTTTEQNQLLQNRPNPFNQSTVIPFHLIDEMEAEILVTDLSGRLVKRIKGTFPKGENEISIDAKEIGGSGVYYYSLRTKHFYAYRKFVIIP